MTKQNRLLTEIDVMKLGLSSVRLYDSILIEMLKAQDAKTREIFKSQIEEMGFARVDIEGKPEVGRFYDGYLACKEDILALFKED